MMLHSKKATSRKRRPKSEAERARAEELENLLVFGYSCKVYDDERIARDIDKGKYLIPWQGDDRVMIDRFDGRGHLHDLSQDETEWNAQHVLSEEEDRIEALCDQERYLALHSDLIAEEHRQEEEMKRLNEAISAGANSYNAVAFNYDDSSSNQKPPAHGSSSYDPSQPTEDPEEARSPAGSESADESGSDSEEPFIAPDELKVPPEMEMPQTAKMHAIIEKTSVFVARQGPQMEIVLKLKQNNNSQFDFLNFDHYLNPYYKHLVKVIKAGQYTPRPQPKPKEEVSSEDESDDENDNSGYLHPSLMAPKKTQRATQQAAHPSTASSSASTASHQPQPQPQPSLSVAAVLGSAYGVSPTDMGTAMSANYSTATSGGEVNPLPSPPLPSFPAPQGDPATFSLPLPAPPGLEPVTLPSLETATLAAMPPPPPPQTMDHISNEYSGEKMLMSQHVVPPPPDIQPVIDKMAKYVAKNGQEFEMTVRAKNDPRFEFLLPWHNFHAYYVYKKSMFMAELHRMHYQATQLQKAVVPAGPVSFSIKTKEPEEKPRLESRTALPQEEESNSSSDGEGQGAAEVKGEQRLQVETEVKIEETKKPLTPQQIAVRQAKQRLEDKLAAAAREKLAQNSKQHSIQLERKKKAAMFINMLKANQGISYTPPPALPAGPEEGGGGGRASPGEGAAAQGAGSRPHSPSSASSSSSHKVPRSYRKGSRKGRADHHQERSQERSRSPKRSRSHSPKRRHGSKRTKTSGSSSSSSSSSSRKKRAKSRSPPPAQPVPTVIAPPPPPAPSPPPDTVASLVQLRSPQVLPSRPASSTVSKPPNSRTSTETKTSTTSIIESQIKENLMAKVRAMLAASRTPTNS